MRIAVKNWHYSIILKNPRHLPLTNFNESMASEVCGAETVLLTQCVISATLLTYDRGQVTDADIETSIGCRAAVRSFGHPPGNYAQPF